MVTDKDLIKKYGATDKELDRVTFHSERSKMSELDHTMGIVAFKKILRISKVKGKS